MGGGLTQGHQSPGRKGEERFRFPSSHSGSASSPPVCATQGWGQILPPLLTGTCSSAQLCREMRVPSRAPHRRVQERERPRAVKTMEHFSMSSLGHMCRGPPGSCQEPEETKAKVRNFPRASSLAACAVPSGELPGDGRPSGGVAAQKRKFMGRKGGQPGMAFSSGGRAGKSHPSRQAGAGQAPRRRPPGL